MTKKFIHNTNWDISYRADASYNSKLSFLFILALRSSSMGAYKASSSKDIAKKKARFKELYGEE
ncbi:hypothetical protein MJH12_19950 [bacterium]|nr:hypothetical protein [bacterium]